MTAVHELMSTTPVTVSPTTPFAELLSLFARHGYSALPVVTHEGHVVGIVSKLDLLRPLVARRSRISKMDDGTPSAADIMQKKVVSVEAQDSIADVGRLMLVTKLRSLPVVHRRTRSARPRLVGMVSRGDVLRGLGYRPEPAQRRPRRRGRRA
ncbi:MAG TPA: CBS domain-containing protein [Gemmatimonadales bacterium]|nr:CBS domain-containing protein [Gemmatimonadales bacterium]